MNPLLFKILPPLAIDLVSRAINYLSETTYPWEDEEVPPEVPPTPKKNVRADKTLITQNMYDFAAAAYAAWKANNNWVTIYRYCPNRGAFNRYLNETFGTHKSASSLYRLCKGQYNRDKLIVGAYYSEFENLGEVNERP